MSLPVLLCSGMAIWRGRGVLEVTRNIPTTALGTTCTLVLYLNTSSHNQVLKLLMQTIRYFRSFHHKSLVLVLYALTFYFPIL